MTSTSTAQSFDPIERRQYIGCSELAALMNADPYSTPLDIFNVKTGRVAPFEGNNHTERGRRLEHIAAELYTEITGQKLRRMTRDLIHPEHSFIRGHIDRLVEGEKTVAEIKVVSVASYRKLQREGLPENYIIQLNAYLGLGGYKKGIFIIFCPDQFDCISFPVEFSETLFDVSTRAAVNFWFNHVMFDAAPTADKPETSEVEIQKIGGNVTVRDDQAFIDKAAALKEAASLKRDAEELYELAKQDIIDSFEGECGAYECPGIGRLYYTQSAGRVTFDKKTMAAEHPEIDLSRYNKQGKSFFSLRTYFEGR